MGILQQEQADQLDLYKMKGNQIEITFQWYIKNTFYEVAT